MMGYSWDWDKIANFIQVVGVPMACLLLFTGPFIWLAFSLGRKYGTKMAEAHLRFMDSATKTQEVNAETLQRLESTLAVNQSGHAVTHQAISLVSSAGLAMIEGDHPRAKNELAKVDLVLKVKPSQS